MVRRTAAAKQHGPQASVLLRDHLLTGLSLNPSATVAGYAPMRSEISPTPTLEVLHQQGHPTCLPVVLQKNTPLLFRVWAPGDPLEKGVFHTQIPPASAGTCVPDVLLVPLLAFTSQGQRLGYGGGFYDRTLQMLRSQKSIVAVGVAYSEQECPTLPIEPTDEPLDWICTEAGCWPITTFTPTVE
jgi:5-formyltetrahydrofolate cyclo-ligase